MGNLVLTGATSGSITLEPTAVAGSNTITLPANTGTLLTTGSSGQSIPKAALPTGSVLQVVQGTLAGSVSTNSATPVDTGLTVTITPTSATSKILVMFTHPVPLKGNSAADLTLTLVRDSTTLVNYNDALFTPDIGNNYNSSIGGTYLDSPATTSATIYKTRMANGQNSGHQVYPQGSGPGSIIVMEIAA